ncbi:glycoside hydrolase family 25 protein [uncultured Oscillibacter sp.]|uniref:glycoside hydrolase family 25 protein n=1 Tax=uncultured Oscillibacter sp. TaxID=876091 RepID=UPI002613B37C|nr:glycoside hydrolase family 25 protein [uncultured Oscillibacter sp.]
MRDGLSGLDINEREAARTGNGELPPTGRRQAPPPARRRPGGNGLGILSLAISIVALIAAGTALFLVLGEYREPGDSSTLPEEEPVTFQFGDMVLTPLEGMPLNPYDQEAFGLDEKGRVTYEKHGRRGRAGIDVSTHQKDIAWPSVAADGIEFAILRLGHRGYTEGGLFLDETFKQNLQGALDAGLEVGVYFFSQAVTPEEAEEEADYVLEVLDGQELAFPVAFDWESIPGDEARTDGLDGEMLTRCAAAFCKRMEDAGYRAAVYFNQTQGYLRYDLRDLTDYELWLAEYDAVPDFYYHFDLWQYTHTGRVDGIQGDVDMDLAF